MELRKHVRQPSRYEPELPEERYTPRTKKLIFRPPFVDFNPHLPPAAFPSLDEPRVNLSETHHVGDFGSNGIRQIVPPNNTCQRMDSTQPLLPSGEGRSHVSLRDPMISASVPSCWNYNLDEGHRSSIRNYSLHQDGLRKELQAQKFLHDMETSDEDAAASDRRPDKQISSSKITWDKLQPAHRLEILDSMAVQGISIENILKFLGITQEQYDEMVEWDNLRNKVADRENSKLYSMQQDVHQRLLNTGEFRTGSITEATYKQLFNHHLGSIVKSDKQNFTICTNRDLMKAQAFLQAKGLTATLAGLWEEPMVGVSSQGTDASGSKENTDEIIQDPAKNWRPERSVTGSLSRRAAEERGRSPVRRKHFTHHEEILSSQACLLPTEQGQLTMPPNGTHTPAEQVPVQVVQNISRIPVQDMNHHAPTYLNGQHTPTRYSATAPGQKMNASANEADDIISTITVEPKQRYQGTAKPRTSTQMQPLATNNSPSEYIALQERQRLESLKHSARPGQKVGPRVEMEGRISLPTLQTQTNGKKFRQLAIATPSSSGVKPIAVPLKPGTSSLTGTGLTATPATLGNGAQSSPITPTLTGSGSGSSTRSQMATRTPARYRDDLIEIGSPTNTRAEKKTTAKTGMESKPPSKRGGWRGGPKKHVLEGGAAQDAPDPKKKQMDVPAAPDNKTNGGPRGTALAKKSSLKGRPRKGMVDNDPDR